MLKSIAFNHPVLARPVFVWLVWVFANTVGAFLAIGATFLGLLTPGIDGDKALLLIAGLAFSLSLSIVQSIVLSIYVPIGRRWVLVSLVGWLSASIATMVIFKIFPIDNRSALLPVLTIFGACTSLAQWVVLKGYFSSAGLWVLASVFGWGLLALWVGRAFTHVLQAALIGSVPAMFTGLVLALARRLHSNENSPGS